MAEAIPVKQAMSYCRSIIARVTAEYPNPEDIKKLSEYDHGLIAAAYHIEALIHSHGKQAAV